jgi:site-specific DNA-methyltransferase (adenine-specific)
MFPMNGAGGHRFDDGKNVGASRFFYVAKASKRERNAGLGAEVKSKQGARPNSADASGKLPDHDHRETGGNNHPTVKPVKLMEYLCNLITPPGGTVLDPFMGSGSTGVAAKNLGFEFIGIEMNEEYFEIAEKRLEANA